MEGLKFFDHYSPAADLLVAAFCIVIFVLVSSSYVNKTKAFGIYLNAVIYLMIAALSDVFYHGLYLFLPTGEYTVLYIARIIYHAALFSNLVLYIMYIVEIQRLERDKSFPVMLLTAVIFLTALTLDILTTVSGTGFRLDASGVQVSDSNAFRFGYLSFVGVILFLVLIFRKRLFHRVMLGLYGTISISACMLCMQWVLGRTSYTVAAFLFPAVAMLYMIHSNPYDIEIGTVTARALEDMVQYHYKRKQELILMSLYLPELDEEGKMLTRSLQDTIRFFASEYFKESVLFQISNGHVVMLASKSKNLDYKQKIVAMLADFYREYEKFGYDYKIVLGDCIDEISRKNEYVRFIKSIYQKMPMNEIHFVEEADVAAFEQYEYIMSELQDIYKKADLDDERVQVYCQPVYSLKTGSYDTAEALMRLRLPQIGLVSPDQFIPLAEENGYIHALTRIILKKTCDEIKKLMESGYIVKRISVNISITELHDDKFSEDVVGIIRSSGIPEDRIAFEITESQSEDDFVIIKKKIDELKGMGIKFYLDDFGTGYSNMERILELPFDIIKFDRSLVAASDGNERSEKMIDSLAKMFSELKYAVLYEGVETQEDEERCKSMAAKYLQGYKYSRPIPISELRNYFSRPSEQDGGEQKKE